MKIGNYVRTNKCIAKYLGLGKDVLKEETNKNTYEHYYNQHIFDNYIFNVEHDYGDTLTDNEFNNIDKLGKVKENIIDLIEFGDYINGHRVIDFMLENGKRKGIIVDADIWGFDADEIKSIVTHEQFSSMEYKVGE